MNNEYICMMTQLPKKSIVDMTIFSLPRSVGKKLYCKTLVLTTRYNIRHLFSTKFIHKTQTTSTNNSLKFLHITTPEHKPLTNTKQNHIRLVEDILRTCSEQVTEQSFSTNFNSSTTLDFKDLLEGNRKVESRVLNNDSLSFSCSSVDARVLSIALGSCTSERDLRGGIRHHCLAIRNGFIDNVYVGSSLISFYNKCGHLGDSYKVFVEMPVRNVVSWTAIISGFAQGWLVDTCFWLYSEMRVSGFKPNDFTFTSLLSGCTGSGALGRGRSVHCLIIQMGFDSYVLIANALISMYCKCGSVESALLIFENMVSKDVVSWNSMVAGFAHHGMAAQAILLFEKMKLEVIPDAITFLGVLSSCRHAGLVNDGRKYFNLMIEYGLKPELDHYSCLVDLLGRARQLEEARDLIKKMPMPPNAVIWGSLLSSCRLHGSVWIGIEAAESRLLLEPDCAATHVLLANLYASVRCWDQAARVRKLMKDRGLTTSPGYSWIEIQNEVHRFRVEDMSSNRLVEVLQVLECLIEHMIPLQQASVIREDPSLNINS